MMERRRRKKEGAAGFFFPSFFQGASHRVVSRKVYSSSGSKESRESRRGGPRIVRPARGDNLQETTEMDWRSMLFSPIEKFPVRERFTRPFFLFFSLIYLRVNPLQRCVSG